MTPFAPSFRPGGAARRSRARAAPVFAVPGLLFLGACATLQQLVALEHVDFDLAGVTRIELGGIDVTAVRSASDISVLDGLSLANQIRAGSLPLAMTLDVSAENPATNTDARMVRMDWTLFLDQRETISGRLTEEVSIPSGTVASIPVDTELDLLEFFDGGVDELVALVRSAAGLDGSPPSVTLEVLPVIRTALGDIPYDRPLRISLAD